MCLLFGNLLGELVVLSVSVDDAAFKLWKMNSFEELCVYLSFECRTKDQTLTPTSSRLLVGF